MLNLDLRNYTRTETEKLLAVLNSTLFTISNIDCPGLKTDCASCPIRHLCIDVTLAVIEAKDHLSSI